MPGLVRKLVIFAAVDGLVLQPLAQRNQQRPIAPVKIDYKSHAVSPSLRDDGTESNKTSLEAYGIIGLLTVSNYAYLISISRRTQVAQIWGKPIYAITGISIIPINSQAEAQQAIDHARRSQARHARSEHPGQDADDGDGSESDKDTVMTEDETTGDTRSSIDSSRTAPDEDETKGPRELGIVEDVIRGKGAYGRFANRWFSKRGWNTDQTTAQKADEKDNTEPILSRNRAGPSPEHPYASADSNKELGLGKSASHQRWPESAATQATADRDALSSEEQEHLTTSLLPKLLQTTKLLFNSRTFYYAFDVDISRSSSTQLKKSPDLHLYKQVDELYFWNRHLTMPFVEAGFGEYVLPVMQGFIGQRAFSVRKPQTASPPINDPVEPRLKSDSADLALVKHTEGAGGTQEYLLTLISRRSVERSGLRYLRRGIDENGNTANAVETEQILSTPDWDSSTPISSFVQFRGSIPVFFSQTPYTFKPVPVLTASVSVNQRAMRKHFSDVSNRYGRIQAVSLIDRHGNEQTIGDSYEENIKLLNKEGGINGHSIAFNWFEFHKVCRGMKFENVSILVDSMASFLESSGWTSSQNGSSKKTQAGAIRTNCMDCLDRTNVVQSAFGQYILEQQLASYGHKIDLRHDPTTSWFNMLWADNGDAISRAYAGTAALKGDYTRTRKRNAIGALTDLSLTLSRYYRNLFEDFFAQAAIDYLLGTVTEAVFSEFEATMTTADPALDLRKARQSAISTAANVVIEDSNEDLVTGWALATPASPNSLRSFPFEEAILLLTDKALYAVRFEWSTDKVRSFERIELSRVQSLTWGTYITETNAAAQMDTQRNVGFVVKYSTASTAGQIDAPDVRVNTRTLGNMTTREDATTSATATDTPKSTGTEDNGELLILAFKALPSRSSILSHTTSKTTAPPQSDPGERESVQQICEEIVRVARSLAEVPLEVERGDVIGVEEAKRQAGWVEKLGYGLKRLVWG